MAVLAAVEALAQNGNGTELVHDGSDADLNELGVIAIAVGDVSRRYVAACRRWPGQVLGSRLGGRVGSVEAEVSGIEVQAVERELGQEDGLGSDGGQDGMALGEEGIECSSEAIIVEAECGDVPEEVSPGALGPVGYVDECGGLAEPGGEQEAEDATVREGQLGVWRQVAIDDGCNVELLE